MSTAISRKLSTSTVAQWYCLIVGAFLLVRSVTTLITGAEFTLPGSGWRACLQLVVALTLLVGLRLRPLTVVTAVGALYALETLLGILGGGEILGVIPVDMRDRIVHPTLAVSAALVVLITLRARRGEADA
ncbi:hypothetical protein [Nocardia beijingensis]|uniref:DUF4383 domain-containing protein n=1 Tax=Nocardia beijingensis TaxID=95162 RepID=A0ABW7W7T0_9NOCA